jgi:hypothetical protein
VTPEQRAARIADARAILDALEADEALPLPIALTHAGFYFRAPGPAPLSTRRQLAALEAAIPAVFGTGCPDGFGDWLVEGLMPGGVKIQLKAFADHVAREVTAVREMPVTDWERLPAEDEAPESGQA